MQCGSEIFVKDPVGSVDVRFIAQCGGRFMVISHTTDIHNGWLLPDWKSVLRQLVALTRPAKLTEQLRDVASAGSGTFYCFPLAYPLPITGLAGLLGVPADEVAAQLADLAVETS